MNEVNRVEEMAQLGASLLGVSSASPPPEPLPSSATPVVTTATLSPPAPAPAPAPTLPQQTVVVEHRTIAPPARQPRTAKAAVAAATAAGASAALKKILGPGEALKIWKVDSRGHNTYCGDYSLDDLGKAGHDIEAFLQQYLVPSFEEGEFIVQALSAAGNPVGDNRSFFVYDRHRQPRVTPPAQGEQHFVQSMTDKLWHRMTQLENAERQRQSQPPRSLAEQARELREVKETIGGDSSQVLLYMLQQQQARQTDPGMAAELASMRASLEMARRSSAPPLALPAAGADASLDGVAKLLEVMRPQQSVTSEMAALLSAITPLLAPFLARQEDGEKDLLRRQVEALERKAEQQALQPPRSLRDVLEEMSFLDGFFEKRYGRGGSSLGQAVQTFMDNFSENAESFAKLLREIRTKEDKEAKAAEGKDTSKAAEPAEEEAGDEVPEDVLAQVALLDEATTAMERVKIALVALNMLGRAPAWKVTVRHLLGLARKGDKAATMKLLGRFLSQLPEHGIVSQDAVDKTIQAFDAHFESVVSYLDAAIGQAQRQAPPTPAPEANPAIVADQAAEASG